MKEKGANCDCGLGTGKTTVAMGDNPLTILPKFSKLVCEISLDRFTNKKGDIMSDHRIHDEHPHTHGPDCGHTVLRHEDHQDYLHDGHLHFLHDGHIDEHDLSISAANPATCTPDHSCNAHDSQHRHGPSCGHEAIPHGDHKDYLVDDHLHFPHGAHCDDHGKVQVS